MIQKIGVTYFNGYILIQRQLFLVFILYFLGRSLYLLVIPL